MIITALVENTSACGLTAEHGLSLFVEMPGCRFLFDLGQTDLFARNAAALGVDPDQADFAVISHGHYDHGGGLRVFLALNRHAPVYVNRHAFEPHFHGPERDIGLDASLMDQGRIILAEDTLEIRRGCTLHACRDAAGIMDVGSAGLHRMEDGRLLPEDFRHEQYLLVEENDKRILFSGCSHRGILNIMHWFRPDVLIGGFHFSALPLDDTLAAYARALDAYPTVYYTCHCTGTAQYDFMKGYMKNLRYLSTGQRVTV